MLCGVIFQRANGRVGFALRHQACGIDGVQGLDVSTTEVLGLARVVSTPLIDPVGHFQLGGGQVAHHANVVAQHQKQVIVLVSTEYFTGQCFNFRVLEQRLLFPVVGLCLFRVGAVGKGFGRWPLAGACRVGQLGVFRHFRQPFVCLWFA
ncbi:hypothetical protein D3C81_835280 [compost metagenome]